MTSPQPATISSASASLVGSYVALQINAKAMVAEYADSPILALAKALGTQKYVALVEKEVQVASCSDEPMWRVYRVSFVGRHTRPCHGSPGAAVTVPRRSPQADGCLPIYPANPSCHATAQAPVRPSKPFPKHDCCHRPGVETFIRVHRQPQHAQPQWMLASEQMRRVAVMRRKLSGEDDDDDACTVQDDGSYVQVLAPWGRSNTTVTNAKIRQPAALSPSRNEHYPFAVHASTGSSSGAGREKQLPQLPPPSPLSPLNPNFNSVGRTSSPAPSASGDGRVFTPASHTTSTSAAETSVSELFDQAARVRHDTMDSASVYSADTRSTSVVVLLESPSTSKLALTLECDADLDDIPLVDVSFDLAELVTIPDPVEFLEERNVVAQLVRKAETRHRNTPTPSIVALDAHSAFDVESRRLSLARVRSQQSQRTVVSRAASPLSVPPIVAPGPAKLRKSRSRSSYRQLPPDARSVRSERDKDIGEGREREKEKEKEWERKRERTFVEWLAALAERPVLVIFKTPAEAVGRWVRYVARKGKKKAKALTHHDGHGEDPVPCP